MKTKLSPTMKDHLRSARITCGGPGATVRGRPPGHPENLRTFEALVRRGMPRVDGDGYIEVTEAGRTAEI